MVKNYELRLAGIKKYVGREKRVEEDGRIAFVPSESVDEVDYRAEYVKACADGDLWAADEETAKACGVKFDSAFGELKPTKGPASP